MLVAAWLAACASPSTAAAQPRATVVVIDLRGCDASRSALDQMVAHARVELTSDGVDDVRSLSDSPDDDAAIALVTIETYPPCEGAFVVRVEDHVTDKRLERQVDLRGLDPRARPRALALALAELLRASWAEMIVAPAPEAAPASIVTSTSQRAVERLAEARELADPAREGSPATSPPPGPETRLAIGAALLVRGFVGVGGYVLGARAEVDVPIASGVLLSFDLEGAASITTHALGSVELGLGAAGVGLHYAAPIDALTLRIGARAAAGAGWTRGEAADPRTIAGTGAGAIVLVSAVLGLDVAVSEGVVLVTSFDAGGVPLGFDARVDGIGGIL